MKEYIIDCSLMTDRDNAHRYLAQALELPEHYGKNLDALHDCLGELPPCHVTIRNLPALSLLGEYGDILKTVFIDASLENDDFELTIENGAACSAD